MTDAERHEKGIKIGSYIVKGLPLPYEYGKERVYPLEILNVVLNPDNGDSQILSASPSGE